MHLIKNLGEILTVDDLCILDLEEVLSSMTVHVYKHLRAAAYFFRLWEVSFVAPADGV